LKQQIQRDRHLIQDRGPVIWLFFDGRLIAFSDGGDGHLITLFLVSGSYQHLMSTLLCLEALVGVSLLEILPEVEVGDIEEAWPWPHNLSLFKLKFLKFPTKRF